MITLLKSFAKFQSECPPISPTKKGYGYMYAPLNEILEKVNPILHKNNLCLIQYIDDTTIRTYLYSIDSGKKISSRVEVPKLELKGMNVAQSQGAGISYFRRYAITTILGLSTETETDLAKLPNKKANKTDPGDDLPESDILPPEQTVLPWLNPGTPEWINCIKGLNEGKTVEEIQQFYKISKKNQELLLTSAI